MSIINSTFSTDLVINSNDSLATGRQRWRLNNIFTAEGVVIVIIGFLLEAVDVFMPVVAGFEPMAAVRPLARREQNKTERSIHNCGRPFPIETC